jgi:hypothetical protein
VEYISVQLSVYDPTIGSTMYRTVCILWSTTSDRSRVHAIYSAPVLRLCGLTAVQCTRTWSLERGNSTGTRNMCQIMSTCNVEPLSDAYIAAGFCVGTLPISIQQPRSIAAVGPTDF